MWNLALMGATALLGANKARRQQEANKQYNLAQAEMTRYSPWTGQSGQLQPNNAPSQFEGAVGGALQGASMAQGLGLFNKPTTGMGGQWDDFATASNQTPKATLYGNSPWMA